MQMLLTKLGADGHAQGCSLPPSVTLLG